MYRRLRHFEVRKLFCVDVKKKKKKKKYRKLDIQSKVDYSNYYIYKSVTLTHFSEKMLMLSTSCTQ